MKNEYWISEYVITKNDNAVRGIYVSKERFNPDKPEYFLAVYTYRNKTRKIGFSKRSQRKHLLRKLMSTKNIVSAAIGKECVKDIYNLYSVFRCNIGKINLEELQKLKAKLEYSRDKDHFSKFFSVYESKGTDKGAEERSGS